MRGDCARTLTRDEERIERRAVVGSHGDAKEGAPAKLVVTRSQFLTEAQRKNGKGSKEGRGKAKKVEKTNTENGAGSCTKKPHWKGDHARPQFHAKQSTTSYRSQEREITGRPGSGTVGGDYAKGGGEQLLVPLTTKYPVCS